MKERFFRLPQVLVELVVTDQDRAKFERALDGGSAVFAKAPDFEDVFRRLGLNDDAEAISAQIDGVKSAADVASASRRDTFNAYKLMHALATLGILRRVDKTAAAPQFALDDFASAGVADAADMLDEPQPAPEPQFSFDEAEALQQPTLEVPAMSFDDAPAGSAASAWDETEETAVPEPPKAMPSWDTPTRAVPVAAPPPIPPITKERANVPTKTDDEEQWGFDDAQLETAQRATSAKSATPPPKEGRRYGLLLALMVIFILVAAGYFGFRWWQGREDAATATPVAVNRPVRRPRPTPIVPVTTTEPVASTVTIAGTTHTVATTTITEKPGAPMQITAPPPPAVEPVATQALPAVVRKQGGGGTKYDAMAREYASNATGNFTVQIQILCEASNLDKAILTGGANIWFVPQQIGARSCYRLFWGHYATRDEAQRALPTIPASLRDKSSAVKPVPR